MAELIIRDLHVSVGENEILKGFNLTVEQGKVHTLMGPNGSGKSTLAYTLAGHPNYEVTQGEIIFDGQDVLEMEPDERSHAGLFLAFQYPVAIPGVTVANFLRTALNAKRKAADPEYKGIPIPEFRNLLKEKMDLLDETDSGLDIDALRNVAEGVEALRGPNFGVLLITHYQRILNYIKPDFVHIMLGGRIVESGGPDLALKLEEKGYDWIREKHDMPVTA